MGDLNFPPSVVQWPRVDGCIVPLVHNHRSEETADGLQVRLQADRLCELMLEHNMAQQVDQPTHLLETLDLVFTGDQQLISYIRTESFQQFTDHKVLSGGEL